MKHNPDLLRTLATHFRAEPAVRVVVITEGPGAEYLRNRKDIERLDNLIILPFESFAVMPDVLAAADVLVSVLDSDAGVFSVPSKVLTYLTAGRVLLGAMPTENLAARIIGQQAAGLCVAPTDMAGFLAAAERLFADASLRTECAARGRHYAETEFAIGTIADRFEGVFLKARNRSKV
jgi:glycosyltransferase involved in cell wall biosynthesis